MEALKLIESRHPDKNVQKRYDSLIGIDDHKSNLLFTLHNVLDSQRMDEWIEEYYPKGIPHLKDIITTDPLIVLSGDVGCGKTELAQCISTPLSERLGGETIVLFETPSNIRGTGFVGELSSRITAAFGAAKSGLKKNEYGILLIDEADDLATNRDQLQAHHEDRSGVNVLIKEIDKVHRDGIKLAVILITNRPSALDPAVVRRAGLHLHFKRPDGEAIKKLFKYLFKGVGLKEEDFDKIVESCIAKETQYSYSDLTKRIIKSAFLTAWRKDTSIDVSTIMEIIEQTPASPLITEKNKV